MKKVSKNFQGICKLCELPKHVLFKRVNKDGSLSKKVYIMYDKYDGYDRSSKKYAYSDYSDYCVGYKASGEVLVSTDFIY